ncbi:putative lectin family integral membrane protein [Ascodesmis nigricans]|uniref:Putative lectin family integral membrane protein n=1 Tax=Ascodesmis nigricans TaxID=341454 RepID=A0A4S2MRC0_9PEZI|nr:putative lectin family integral membrane protein [Ascodesmis nigricans]
MWTSKVLAVMGALGAAVMGGVNAVAPNKDGIKSVPLRTHSFQPPYMDSDLQSRWFDWGGDTIVRVDQYIRLSSENRQGTSGYLWSKLPLTATNWEIEFEFHIHGNNHLFGDGMAMWITKQRALQGPVFGSIDNFEGLGLFFDTYKNNRPGVVFPYISAMLGDGKTSYDHNNDGKDTELAGCSARGIRNAHGKTMARLTYFQEDYLRLELLYRDDGEWIECFNVQNVTLPQVAYLGFTAHCGELTDNHDIIEVTAKNLYSTDPTRPGPGSSGARKADTYHEKVYDYDNPSSGWGWFFVKLILFVLVSVAGYVGFTAYRIRQQKSRF